MGPVISGSRTFLLASALALLPSAMHGAANSGVPLRPVMSSTGAVGPALAPVSMVVFSDFACPFSSQLFFTLEKLEVRYPTQLRVILKQSPLPIHLDAALAHRAALAAGRQARFGEMAELLYANQTRLDMDALLGYARQLRLDIPRFRRDIDSPAIAEAVNADIEESHAFGIDSTPTIFLNGHSFTGIQTEDTLAAAIDKATAGAANAAATAPAGSMEPTLDAALLAEIEANPTAVQGGAKAPLTIVEFTDFQCPFCRSAVGPMQQLMAARGHDVRWEFRAFPLDFHPDAEPAAEAALAAGAQGKFWPMHDLLFAHQNALKPADLRGYAEQLQLDMKAFDEALATHRYAGQIAADRALGARAGVSGTPTFVIDGRLITGARQLPELNQIADAHMAPGFSPSGAQAGPVPAATVAGPVHQISGAATAPLTLMWFTDVRSPLAARQAELVRSLTAHYGDKIRVVYKAFPVATHTDGRLGSAALLAAEEHGKFWEMFDLLAQRRDVLDPDKLVGLAAELHLGTAAFRKELDAAAPAVAADVDEATRRGIQGAPVFFVNGQRVDGMQREAFYTAILDKELQSAPVPQASIGAH